MGKGKKKKKKNRFHINRLNKLMRQRIRNNKKRKKAVKTDNHEYLRVDTIAVNKILEANGFGKGRGEEILNNNGISLKGRKQIIESVTIQMPQTLSMSDDSDSAIKFLMDCYNLIVNNNISKIVFDHTTCAELGLSASTFMDLIVITASAVVTSRLNKKRYNISMGPSLVGIMNPNSDISKILRAGGLPKHLGANMYGLEIPQDDISLLDVISGSSQRGEARSAATATKLTEYFQKCLNKEGMELSPEGGDFFTDLFGEVLSNCEIHGGVGGSWYTQGVYQKKDYGGEMQLMFMNIGDTIYEGLSKHSSQETLGRLKALLNIHSKYICQSWTKEMIYTLFALQDGISRFRERNKEGCETRGNGTIVMINAFQAIGARIAERIPQLTIISGNTRIVFNDNYRLKKEYFNDDIFGKGPREIIAFNSDNDIYKPADPQNVMKCNMRFPGTVISLKFVLNRDYVERLKREVV